MKWENHGAFFRDNRESFQNALQIDRVVCIFSAMECC